MRWREILGVIYLQNALLVPRAELGFLRVYSTQENPAVKRSIFYFNPQPVWSYRRVFKLPKFPVPRELTNSYPACSLPKED